MHASQADVCSSLQRNYVHCTNFWDWKIPCSVDTHGMEGQDPATALKTWVPLLQTQLCYALAEALKVSKVTLIPVLFIWHWLFGKLVISERKRKKLRWNWSNFCPVWTGFLKLPCKLSLVNPSPGVKTSRQRWCWGSWAKSRTPKGAAEPGAQHRVPLSECWLNDVLFWTCCHSWKSLMEDHCVTF